MNYTTHKPKQPMTTMKLLVHAAALCVTFAFTTTALAQGPLTPPGPPGPIFKTLQQIEPRVDVNTLGGDGNSLIVIDQPGSYYLTANILGVAGKNGICIKANHVTLDLNGFTLQGVPNALNGVLLPSVFDYTVVRNGRLQGWGQSGLDFGSNGFGAHGSRLEDVIAADNGAYGIYVSGAEVRRCTGLRNRYYGLFVYDGSVTDCTAEQNDQDGIEAVRTRVVHCAARYNREIGIWVDGGEVRDSECTGNARWGISVTSQSLILQNVCRFNGSETNADSAGIRGGLLGGSRIEGNTVHFYFGTGLSIGFVNPQFSFPNVIVKNICIGSAASAYSIGPGNNVGPIGTADTATSPFANLRN